MNSHGISKLVSLKSHLNTNFQTVTVHFFFLERTGKTSGARCSPVVGAQAEAGVAAKQPECKRFHVQCLLNVVGILDSFNLFQNDQCLLRLYFGPLT